MAGISEIGIKVEIEPVVKLICMNVECYHNLSKSRGVFCCNLKHLKLDGGGECTAAMVMDYPEPYERSCEGIEGGEDNE